MTGKTNSMTDEEAEPLMDAFQQWTYAPMTCPTSSQSDEGAEAPMYVH